MSKFVEIFLIDEEGILLRSHIDPELCFYVGDLEDPESPLMIALKKYYRKKAPKAWMGKGFETPRGMMYWCSELASPFGDDGHLEIGERLFLADDTGERFYDDLAYETLAKGKIPVGWELIAR